MSRMKTFGIYLLIFVGFYIFSNIIAYFYIQSTYEAIEANVIESNNITVEVDEAKATIVNGYIEGKVSNTTDKDIQSKYIKIDLISKRENTILTKYIEIDELKSGETKEFKLNFQAENIKKFKIEVVENAVNNSNSQIINIGNLTGKETMVMMAVFATLIFVRYIWL